MKKLSVVTPTYNRANLLLRCFQSLRVQTCNDFEWIVIDDGSTDNTESLVNLWIQDADLAFPIIYHRKENGGKHTALNESHSLITGKYVVILDSDDSLIPSAVQTICNDWEEYYQDKSVACLSYYKSLENGKVISKEIDTRTISDHITFRVNQDGGGDQCEVVRTEYFKSFTFPVFPEERFVSEGMLWNYLGFRYKTVYCNKSIYVCEYQPEGISKTGRKLLMHNPKGMIALTKTFFDKRIAAKKRLKETWLYIVYCLCDKQSLGTIIRDSGQSFITLSQLPVGIVLYLYWKRKYM